MKLNRRPAKIDPLMADPNQDPTEEWRIWFPIDSKVSDNEIAEFEMQIGHKLPSDYIIFLKYKHFYELNISEASFCKHPVNTWRRELVKMIYEGYPKEYLIDKGLIPFADWSDWGLLCFDTNRNFLSANYPIVLWDHEIADWNKDFCISFKSLIKKLDKDDKESWAQNES